MSYTYLMKKIMSKKKNGAFNVLIFQMLNLSMCECFWHNHKRCEEFFQAIGVF